MRRQYNQYNPKRKLKPLGELDLALLAELAKRVQYGGNPEHKKNPGDFGLEPPSGHRPAKSLCNTVTIFKRAEALELLRIGLSCGLVSDRFIKGWPKNIWSMSPQGDALEAQLENIEKGSYHGYPIPGGDAFSDEVKQRWKQNHD